MNKLENTDFPDLTLDSIAIWTVFCFSTLRVDFLADLCTPQIINVAYAKLFKKISSFWLCQKNSSTVLSQQSDIVTQLLMHWNYLANFLEYGHG